MAYTVKKGDTLSQLYGSNWQQLSGYTGDPTKLQIGTQLNDLPGTPNTLTTENISPTSKVDIPPQVDPNANLYNGIATGGNSIILPPTPEDPYKVAKDYASSLTPPASTADQWTEAQTGLDPLKAGLAGATNEVTQEQANLAAIIAQIKGLSDQATAQNLSLENQGAGITAGGVQRSQQANIREIAIKSLPLQSLALASQAKILSLQGNQTAAQTALTNASDKLDTLFKLKQQDVENTYKYNKDIADRFYDQGTQIQKDALDQKRIDDKRKYDETQDIIKYQRDLADTALANGDGASFTKISALDPKSPTYKDDLARLAGQIKAKPTKTTPEKETDMTRISKIKQFIDLKKGEDKLIAWETYADAAQNWIAMGGTIADFKAAFPPERLMDKGNLKVLPTSLRPAKITIIDNNSLIED